MKKKHDFHLFLTDTQKVAIYTEKKEEFKTSR